MKTNEEVVYELIEKCLKELELAHKEKYESEKAEKTAAMFLLAQTKLVLFIEDTELRAREAKNEVSRIEAEKYFEYKNSMSGNKTTETMISQYVAKDEKVVESKSQAAKAEASLKKWSYVLATLKDRHIFFRNVGKKNWD